MLHVMRVLFVGVCTLLGLWMATIQEDIPLWQATFVGFGVGLCLALLEMSFARRFAGMISILAFSIVVGFIISQLLVAAFSLVPAAAKLEQDAPLIWGWIEVSILVISTFLAMLTIVHAKDDFKFVIPFLEFSREGRFGRPLLADTSALVDGRLAPLLEARLLDAPIIVPKFVLQELHALSDSADKLKRARGRRGLEVLEKIKQVKGAEVRVHDAVIPDVEGVDQKLIRLAKMLDARILTSDAGLGKVAEVQALGVLNLHELANVMRPPVMAGDKIQVQVVKTGEIVGQGVGYLEDGTMVVGENCAGRIGQEVDLVVTNVIQSNIGRMVFGRMPGDEPAPPPPRRR